MLSEELSKFFMGEEVPNLGTKSPNIYLLVDVPSFAHVRNEAPLINETYRLLIDFLVNNNVYSSEEEILKDINIASSLKYCPTDPNATYKSRKHNTLDLKNLSHLNYQDIDLFKPKVIIASGSDAIRIVTNFKYSSYEEVETLYDYKYNNKIPVVFIPSINNTVFNKQGGFLRKDLNFISGCFKRAKKLSLGETFNHPLKGLKWTHIDVFNPEEVQTLFDLFLENSKLVLDYEADGLNTYRDGFHLGGIGLCSLDCQTSVYVHFYDFFRMYDGTNPVPQESLDILNSFFKTKEFVVFNKQYECSVTISPSVGINFNLEKCEDILMWLRCLSSSSSLKDACVNRFGIQKWNDSVEEWVECINTIVKLEKPTESMKGQRKLEWNIPVILILL